MAVEVAIRAAAEREAGRPTTIGACRPSNARTRAEADGRAKLAATARAQMQQLISNWAKETGDLLDEASVSSLLNDETLIRQVTDTELIGARAAQYAKRDGNQYVLVVMDDPAEWTKRVGAGMRRERCRTTRCSRPRSSSATSRRSSTS